MEQSLVQYKESEENEIRNEVDADDLLFVKLPEELENESDDSNSKDVSALHVWESKKEFISLVVIKDPVILNCVDV